MDPEGQELPGMLGSDPSGESSSNPISGRFRLMFLWVLTDRAFYISTTGAVVKTLTELVSLEIGFMTSNKFFYKSPCCLHCCKAVVPKL